MNIVERDLKTEDHYKATMGLIFALESNPISE